jgi:hypothetical protein
MTISMSGTAPRQTNTSGAMSQHRENLNRWMDKMTGENRLAGGMPLTLNGKIV